MHFLYSFLRVVGVSMACCWLLDPVQFDVFKGTWLQWGIAAILLNEVMIALREMDSPFAPFSFWPEGQSEEDTGAH